MIAHVYFRAKIQDWPLSIDKWNKLFNFSNLEISFWYGFSANENDLLRVRIYATFAEAMSNQYSTAKDICGYFSLLVKCYSTSVTELLTSFQLIYGK